MPADLSTYLVNNLETSNATKFDNLVNAIQAALNAIGDTSKMDFYTGGIPIANLASYPADATKFLKGDGSWGSASIATAGTSFPGSPADGDEYVYVADGTNGVYWHFKYRTATSKWVFTGGAPLYAEVTTAEATSSSSYAALSTAGPAIALPFAGDYDVEIGCGVNGTASAVGAMSYDIGGTGAVDADDIPYTAPTNPGPMALSRRRRKTSLTAVTLTAKYKSDGTSMTFRNRWMAVWPVQK